MTKMKNLRQAPKIMRTMSITATIVSNSFAPCVTATIVCLVTSHPIPAGFFAVLSWISVTLVARRLKNGRHNSG